MKDGGAGRAKLGLKRKLCVREVFMEGSSSDPRVKEGSLDELGVEVALS